MTRRLCAVLFLSAFVVVAALAAGCGGVSKNVSYSPVDAGGSRLAKSVKGIVLPVTDQREDTRIYPKQIIARTSYSGDKSFDINDRPVDEVFGEALSSELYSLGLGLAKQDGAIGPLDKTTSETVRRALMENYPEVKVAFGLKVIDFIAKSKKNLVTTDVKVKVFIELSVLDVETGELFWSDFKTEWDKTVMTADRNYMVDQLNLALAEVMKRAVRDNLSLRDTLVKIANR